MSFNSRIFPTNNQQNRYNYQNQTNPTTLYNAGSYAQYQPKHVMPSAISQGSYGLRQQPYYQSGMQNSNNMNYQTSYSNGKFKKPYHKQFNKSQNVTEKKTKQIARLVRPKNAVMILNELCNNSLNFEDLPRNPNGELGVVLNIEGFKYEGYGTSKPLAKQKAAEEALKNYITNKLSGKLDPNIPNKDLENMETGDESTWLQLASFAIHKLVESWKTDTTKKEMVAAIPKQILKKDSKMNSSNTSTKSEEDSTSQSSEKKVKKPLNPQKEIPENAAELHPCMLLNQMKPGVKFTLVSSIGKLPNIVYTVKTEIDGQEFVGSGTSKKLANKNCAQAVLTKVYNVNYPMETD